MLEINHLNVYYGDFQAVKDVSFSVHPGDFFSIVGSSGCGKTTILRTIAGFESAAGGNIILSGNDITEVDVSKRNIGFIFQNYTLFPHLNVAQNIAYSLNKSFRNKAINESKVKKITDLLRIRDQLNKMPYELSGGQQQRVAIARAWIMEPKLLLLDEPFSNLDAAIKADLLQELRELTTRSGMTVVYVTHDVSESLAYSDRILLLNEGATEQIGTPHELYYHPVNAFVASFIGKKNILSLPWTKKLGLDDCGNYCIGREDITLLPAPESTDAAVFRLDNVLFHGFYYELCLSNVYQKLVVYISDSTEYFVTGGYYEASFSMNDCIPIRNLGA